MGWGAYILKNSKVEVGCSILVIFPDGQIRLKLDLRDETGRILEDQQYATRYFAVLRVRIGNGIRYLPVLSGQQKADEFQRLLMWLRQNFCRGIGENVAPGI